jgi:hypothetical protein
MLLDARFKDMRIPVGNGPGQDILGAQVDAGITIGAVMGNAQFTHVQLARLHTCAGSTLTLPTKSATKGDAGSR